MTESPKDDFSVPVIGLPVAFRQSSPVWVAAMAGGPSTPGLVIAAAHAGHFAQLAAGYKSSAAMIAEVHEVRRAGVELFGVNLFVPNLHRIDPDTYTAYADSLQPTAERLGLGAASVVLTEDDDDWDAKISALSDEPVPVVSFTFGLPRPDAIEALHRAGSVLVQTVTSAEEASRAEEAGIDVLTVQGVAAGGHSGIWDANALPADVPLPRLIADVRAAVALPIVAAGGIAAPADVQDALAAGAAAVAVGTAVLCSPESGASDLHKRALNDPQYDTTVLTRAFTGRPARALLNTFVLDHGASAPSGYPAIHHLTRPLRAAATAAADASAVNLWAGQNWQHAQRAPITTIIDQLLAPGPATD